MVAELFPEVGVDPLKDNVGLVLSTVAEDDGPAAKAWLPAVSCALFAATEIVKAPLPVHPEIVIVRVTVPEPDTFFVHPEVAPAKVTLPATKETVSASV